MLYIQAAHVVSTRFIRFFVYIPYMHISPSVLLCTLCFTVLCLWWTHTMLTRLYQVHDPLYHLALVYTQLMSCNYDNMLLLPVCLLWSILQDVQAIRLWIRLRNTPKQKITWTWTNHTWTNHTYDIYSWHSSRWGAYVKKNLSKKMSFILDT